MRSASVLFIVLLLFVAACKLDNWVARAYHKNVKRAPYDAIIVPGFPYDTTPAKLPWLNVRLYWAKALYDRGITRNIIFSGSAVHTPYTEATVMRIAADSLGIPPEHIFCETEALHSNENVRLGYKLARKLGFKKIAVATDAYQFSYTMAFLWYTAPGAGILPLAKDSSAYYNKPLPQINPNEAFVRGFVPLEQRH